ncbi:DUF1593 domain-containing protein [Mucilaginibacter robiniae]|uniref:DUF1593 domain-containing protein n=1 Tax=Mucilaginibacter robiniae TaxID=2728022 RepID=A0A7L5E3J1_9SPHI|nr:nucleoside hydrolase-like domain-containing protein [Mucilaginibacter robiniae]QJD97930.1 DUF1593 domain-containing protein [Mucilaginibacter robiniae]
MVNTNNLLSRLTTKLILLVGLFTIQYGQVHAQAIKPRIIISTDIGGTDDDDFQSMIHFLMYADKFNTEGLISSPSYGDGKKQDILDMIDLYAKDYPQLKQHADFPLPNALRVFCKQGVSGAAPYSGWRTATEGSDWIVKCAKKKSAQPLWILVWGGLEDVAQALHDVPEIRNKIKVYWIGGPNKKWSINAYAYIVQHFPDLWMIENNATYRGLFLDAETPEDPKQDNYYNQHIKGHGHMGMQFKQYYGGAIKMGDTPSLLYAMAGHLENPFKESWGGSFTKIQRSSHYIFNRNTTLADSVAVYGTVEWHFKGPVIQHSSDKACFSMEILNQQWPGYYLGNGNYAIRYAPKKAGVCTYKIKSDIPGFVELTGEFTVTNIWPGKVNKADYLVGSNWYSDQQEPNLFYGDQQGGRTIAKWRQKFLNDWAKRWEWLH